MNLQVDTWIYVNIECNANTPVPRKARVTKIIDTEYFVCTIDGGHYCKYHIKDVLGLCDMDSPMFPTLDYATKLRVV